MNFKILGFPDYENKIQMELETSVTSSGNWYYVFTKDTFPDDGWILANARTTPNTSIGIQITIFTADKASQIGGTQYWYSAYATDIIPVLKGYKVRMGTYKTSPLASPGSLVYFIPFLK